ncbi:hypothetical protein T4C_5148, partial [Trichinella pseudospiralis]
LRDPFFKTYWQKSGLLLQMSSTHWCIYEAAAMGVVNTLLTLFIRYRTEMGNLIQNQLFHLEKDNDWAVLTTCSVLCVPISLFTQC